MTRCLLTGGAGFIGSHCIEHWLKVTDWEIVVLDGLTYAGDTGRLTDIDGFDWDRVTLLYHDLRAPLANHPTADRIGHVDYIVNMASGSHVDVSIEHPASFFRNNVDVAVNMLEYARLRAPDAKFVQVSTDEVYGPAPAGVSHKEWDPIRPSNPYCLAPGTQVVTPRGLVAIEDFDVIRDRVVSRDRSTAPVGLATRKWEFDHVGPMFRITTLEGHDEITCTSEHVFFSRVNSHRSGGSKIVERKAGDLRVGDRVAMIRKTPFPPDAITPDLSYARFLGYWIGDGSYSARTRYVRLADQKLDYIEFYRDRVTDFITASPKAATGAVGTIYKHGTKDCWYYQMASEQLRRRVDLSDRMNVIDQAMNFDQAGLGEFLAGWIDADGSVALDGGELIKRVDIASVDSRLRDVLKFLLRRLGAVAVNDNAWDRVCVTDASSIRALIDTVPTMKWPDNPQTRAPQRKRGRAEKWIWGRIGSIEEVAYDGKVYDLEVPAKHNYVANYFLVHNSGSKAAQEAAAFSWWRTYGMRVAITNTMNNFAERQHAEKFVPMVIRNLLRGEAVPLHGRLNEDGTWTASSRVWLHARNHADAIRFLLQNVEFPAYASAGDEGDATLPRFNVAGEREIGVDGIVGMIADTLGVEPKIEWVDFHASRPGHDLRYSLDGSKLAAAGWVPPVGLDESFERTVKWYVDHPEWLYG